MGYADIIVGPARVFYAPTGEANPDETNIAYGAAWGGNWSEVGFTKTPLSMSRDVSVFEVFIEQSTLPINRAPTEETVTFETTLAELTADNLQLGMEGNVTTTAAGASQVGYEELAAGGKTSLTIRKWGVEGLYVDTSGNQFPIRIFIHRATATMNGQLAFGKADSAGIPLQIAALADTSQASDEQLFIFQKVTAPST